LVYKYTYDILVWTPCLMHRCMCIWRYILQNYNYKLHFQNLSIYHIARFFLGKFIFIVSTWNFYFQNCLSPFFGLGKWPGQWLGYIVSREKWVCCRASNKHKKNLANSFNFSKTGDFFPKNAISDKISCVTKWTNLSLDFSFKID